MDEDRLRDLLVQLQQMDERERNAALSEIRRNCPDLAPELERQLQANEKDEDTNNLPDSNLSTSPHQPAPPEPDPEADPEFFAAETVDHSPTPSPESTLLLGRYRVDGILGRGGFGRVIKAFDTLLHRNVAIKTHRPDRRRRLDWRQHLIAEARKLAAIDHPNVVRVHDVVEENGAVMIVSAFIDGADLSHHLKPRRLSLTESVAILIGITEALHHVHLQGIVHRDVKPANILVDRQNRPYLADFDIAASETELLHERPSIVGTYAYMSPEQVQGDSHLVDARTDVYSLGVVLYEILTGRVPFPGTTLSEYQDQIRNRPPRPPRTIDDTIPPELEAICLKCLAKLREDRYTTAADLARDLRTWQATLAATVPVTPPGFSSWWRIALAATVLLSLGLSLLFAFGFGSPEPRSSDRTPRVQAVPQPGVWFNLLEEEPTVVVQSERFAWRYNPERKEAWWDANGDCLIRLGTTQSDNYEIEAEFAQARIAGHRGIYLGRPPAKSDGPVLTQCSAVVVSADSIRTNDVALSQELMTIHEPARAVHEAIRLGPRVLFSDVDQERFTLSVRVKGGRLIRASMGTHKEYLIPAPSDAGPLLVGDFGVLSTSGACWLLKARLKLHTPED